MKSGPREKIMWVVCISTDPNKPDVLSTVDVDPDSPTYCQVCIPILISMLNYKLNFILDPILDNLNKK